MKEVTYEDWIKNPTPRMMRCWNLDEGNKVKMRVIHLLKVDCAQDYPVLAVVEDDSEYLVYKHCAEIEKSRRMTQKELSRWFREKPTREYKRSKRTDIVINCFYSYVEEDADQEVEYDIFIREDDGEWREPLVEVEE